MDSNLAPDNTNLDLDLQERVQTAIRSLDVLRGTRAQVDVAVRNGQVTLRGILQSPMASAEVAHAAANVPGAAGVISHLVDDATLSSQVAEALSTDPRTAAIPPGYEVASVYGHVRLIGYFTATQSEEVAAVSRAMAGVRSVSTQAL